MSRNPLLLDDNRQADLFTGARIQRGDGKSYDHDKAEFYNRRLVEANPRRADEIEWCISAAGEYRLRDRDDAIRRHSSLIARRHEAEREEYMRRQKVGPYAPRNQERAN